MDAFPNGTVKKLGGLGAGEISAALQVYQVKCKTSFFLKALDELHSTLVLYVL